MALAILEYDGPAGGGHRFRAEIGTNAYWTWAIGDGRHPGRVDGFDLLGERSYEAPMSGPLPPEARGRTVIEVPASLFEGDNRHVQLLSFRERDMSGPAVSEIVPARHLGWDQSEGPESIGLSADDRGVGLVECYGERQPVSTAMFLEALAGLLPALAPLLSSAPAVGVRFPVELLQLVAQLLRPWSSATPPSRPTASQGPVQPPSALAASLSTEAKLSQAFIAPALIAALPALLPLLEKVLSPETVKSIVGIADPSKLIGTVAQAIGGLAQIGLDAQRELDEHLERLNPGTETPDLERLMQGMSLSGELGRNIARSGSIQRYRRVDEVTLHFADLAQTTLAGREQTCFLAAQDLSFPLVLETPQPIPKATLTMEVKEAGTHKRVAARTWPVQKVGTGRLDPVPLLPKAEAEKLRAGESYLVVMTLLWRSKGGTRLGTSMTQLISMVGRYTFDRVEQTAEVVPLSDVEANRVFWHKAWQGSFSKERRKLVLNCRYQYALNPDATANAQMETELETDTSPAAHEVGTLRSGLAASGFVLNRLLSRISKDPPLGTEELAALSTGEFVDRFSQAARTQVTFRGRPGDSAALWIYPEVKVQHVVLQEAVEAGPGGNVVRFAEHPVSFPFFVLAHFIGVASQ